jgi:hypothetical protein
VLNEVVVTGYAKRADDDDDQPAAIRLRGVSSSPNADKMYYMLNGVPSTAEVIARLDTRTIKNVEVLKGIRQLRFTVQKLLGCSDG